MTHIRQWLNRRYSRSALRYNKLRLGVLAGCWHIPSTVTVSERLSRQLPDSSAVEISIDYVVHYVVNTEALPSSRSMTRSRIILHLLHAFRRTKHKNHTSSLSLYFSLSLRKIHYSINCLIAFINRNAREWKYFLYLRT